MTINIYCTWREFDECELDKKYDLVDFGINTEHAYYKWLRDVERNINVYVR